MRLLELSLAQFRNYEEAGLEFGEFNLIVGPNAQGKTNLLEAILFLATTKSHRASSDDELVRDAEDYLYLGGLVEDVLTQRQVEVTYMRGGRKQVKLDGKVQSRLSTLIGQMKVVFFSPESLTLVKGGPSDRRKFLDVLVSQVRADYLKALQDYQGVLRQRNEALKQIREGRTSSGMLEIWDAPFIESGVLLTQIRNQACAELRPIVQRQQVYLTQGSEYCDLQYMPNVPIFELEADAPKTFSRQLRQSLSVDLARGTTSTGPHRDDLLLTVNGTDARRFASQGQQRTLTLALKLAELEWIRDICGEVPLLLLDDVTSELDEMRVLLLFEALHELPPQVFLTATRHDTVLLEGFPIRVWEVRGGTAKRIE